MADDARQPVAIRIARPYSNEDAFLEHELETLTRTSVVLIGAQSRPQGVVLRFEVTLASGAPLLRGEGRVVGYKANAFGEEPGLTLRFTRLDPRSKALVDRAAALRDARGRGTGRSIPPVPPARIDPSNLEVTRVGPPPSIAQQEHAPTAQATEARVAAPSSPRRNTWQDEPPSQTTAYDRDTLERMRNERLAAEAAPTTAVPRFEPEHDGHEAPPTTSSPRTARQPFTPPPSFSMSSAPRTEPEDTDARRKAAAQPRHSKRQPLEPPRDRAALLERLRLRGRDLSPARVHEILAAARRA